MPYYNDDGTEIFPNLIPKPQLCLSCQSNEIDDPEDEEVLCNLTRLDQAGNSEFICYAYRQLVK